MTACNANSEILLFIIIYYYYVLYVFVITIIILHTISLLNILIQKIYIPIYNYILAVHSQRKAVLLNAIIVILHNYIIDFVVL